MRTSFIAPIGLGVGLTSISLGLPRALERAGPKVGFFKPIAQLHPGNPGPERSSELVACTHGLDTLKPLSLTQVKRTLGDGQLDELLEEVISLYQRTATGKDVVTAEGMVPTRHAGCATRVNFRLTKSLDVEVILVSVPENKMFIEPTDRIGIQAQLFGGPHDPRVLGVILNKVRGEADATNTEGGVADSVRRLTEHSSLLRDNFRLIDCILWQDKLNAAYTRDIADLLSIRVTNVGDYEQHRAQKTVLYVRTMSNTVQPLKPDMLVVTPGDHDDIIPAASLVTMNDIPLTGLLLCSDSPPDPRIMELCHGALQSGLSVLSVVTGSCDTVTNLNRMDKEIPVDDREHTEQVTESVAGHIDFEWLKQRCDTPRKLRLLPSVFRYQVVQHAQKAGKHIVLPEGNEPRTVQVATICQARGIARCVLLTKPNKVQAVAQAQGIVLPGGLETINPDLVRQRHVEPMVELCKGRGLNTPMAEQQLEDSVVLAIAMLTLNEVDDLVSGAIHTIASTIRLALRLIKAVLGYSLVSLVLFMLLPDQVLVCGDCAVNPDSSASDLVEIATQSVVSVQAFDIPTRVVMISYFTGNSGSGMDVDKAHGATHLAREQCLDLLTDGPLQYDAAVIASVGRQRASNNPVTGQATVLIFSGLSTGSTTYKATQRSTDCTSVRPMLQGLHKLVDDLPHGILVENIVYTIALTVIQADAQTPV